MSGSEAVADLPPICSRAGCNEAATASVIWRNPRIHSADRRKVWLACEGHRGFLHDYLAARDFPVVVEEGVTA